MNKTKLEDLINYIEEDGMYSGRLLNILCRLTDRVEYADELLNEEYSMKIKTFGKKSHNEFLDAFRAYCISNYGNADNVKVEKKNATKGGKRYGAGAKPFTPERAGIPKTQHSYNLCNDVVKILNRFDDANYYIEQAVREKYERDNPF